MILCRSEWQPTPVFLPGESHGQRSLVGYSPWGCKEWNRTERLTLVLLLQIYLPYNISIDPFHRGWESPHTAPYVISEMELKARPGALSFHSNMCPYRKPLHSIVFCSVCSIAKAYITIKWQSFFICFK